MLVGVYKNHVGCAEADDEDFVGEKREEGAGEEPPDWPSSTLFNDGAVVRIVVVGA